MAPRRKAVPGVLAGACCLGVWALRSPWLPGVAQVPAKVAELDLDRTPSKAAPQGCEAALAAGSKTLMTVRDGWMAASEGGRILAGFGSAAEKAERRVLDDFDAKAQPGTCAAQRQALQSAIRREAWNTFLMQRQLTEQDQGDALADKLLGTMKRRGGPLRVQEKVDMLQAAVRSYNSNVEQLLPEWAKDQGDPERDQAERRLGELQFGIEDTQEGHFLQAKWDKARIREVVNKRAQGLSLSLDPGLRVMLRPEGFGNLQVFSVGPAGNPSHPTEVQIGILNDGSIADVYREHPVPPLFHMQPAVKVNLNLGAR